MPTNSLLSLSICLPLCIHRIGSHFLSFAVGISFSYPPGVRIPYNKALDRILGAMHLVKTAGLLKMHVCSACQHPSSISRDFSRPSRLQHTQRVFRRVSDPGLAQRMANSNVEEICSAGARIFIGPFNVSSQWSVIYSFLAALVHQNKAKNIPQGSTRMRIFRENMSLPEAKT